MNQIVTRDGARRAIAFVIAAGCMTLGTAVAQQPGMKAPGSDIQRGRYLVRIAGCNDCHTPGYLESNGKVDEKLWLTGSPLGWRGPWGTTYASNLRRIVAHMTEAQWLQHARIEWRPPMPWFNLAAMSDGDLRAIYRYIRHLGSDGEPAPAWVPPDKTPKPPFVQFPAPSK